jgi:hypothetical protein
MRRLATKFGSIKTLIVIWVMILLTYMVFKDRLDNALVPILGGAIVAYFPCNVWQKGIQDKK